MEIYHAVRYVEYKVLRKLKKIISNNTLYMSQDSEFPYFPPLRALSRARKQVLPFLLSLTKNSWRLWIYICQLHTTGSHQCWRCWCYSCWTCNSDSVHCTWHFHHVWSNILDRDNKKQAYGNDGYRWRSSKGSKNCWFVKWRKTSTYGSGVSETP